MQHGPDKALTILAVGSGTIVAHLGYALSVQNDEIFIMCLT